MSYAEKWDKKPKTILSIPKRNFFVMLAAWAGIGGLLGYAVSDFVRMMNMVC